MNYKPDGTYAVCVIAGAMLIIAVILAFAPHDNKIIELGDEVTTTDEYNTLFNDSFTGRVVAIDELYTVRDENMNDRTLAYRWIDKIDAEGDI